MDIVSSPQLRMSTRTIRFILKPPMRTVKKMIEIKNITDIPAEFIFDIDEDQELFNVEPRKGIIQKHIYINVFFSPKCKGAFVHQLNCLVWGHVSMNVG
ncbi:hypothetical protein JTB14_013785 [Gonioctena quinquepunctata]|nr:hypothetical protein JTB14_013785 [Gonioctena quinquepunctata]